MTQRSKKYTATSSLERPEENALSLADNEAPRFGTAIETWIPPRGEPETGRDRPRPYESF
jgi:hypothetical protein